MPRALKEKTTRKSPKFHQGGKPPPYPPLKIHCPVDDCPWSFLWPYDLRRHSLTHGSPEERAAHMYSCKWPGCDHTTLQASNMETHYRTHTGEKTRECPECTYTTGDPASLTNHRKKKHVYKPRKELEEDNCAIRPIYFPDGALYPSSSSSYHSPSPSGSSSSSPRSVYSELSAYSWGASSSSSFDAPRSPAYSTGYDAQSFERSNNYAYGHSSPGPSSSWSDCSGVTFDTASAMPPQAFPDACARLAHAYGLVPSTARPGPTVLYPAQYLNSFQSASMILDAELSALLAEAAGLEASCAAPPSSAPAYFTPLPSPTLDDQVAVACALELELCTPDPAPVFDFELRDPVTYHANAVLNTVFDSERTGVKRP
ncbi:hypothetical protein B0H19DRAFT_1068805 [Mycena capillaripes]|nr:hypothetical protein B0H19DRAFT_1068805 [Mycena capillaripes]